MTIERDEFQPAPPSAPSSTLPAGLRARLAGLGLELASLAAALTRNVRQEEARFDRRRQRRRERSVSGRKGSPSA